MKITNQHLRQFANQQTEAFELMKAGLTEAMNDGSLLYFWQWNATTAIQKTQDETLARYVIEWLDGADQHEPVAEIAEDLQVAFTRELLQLTRTAEAQGNVSSRLVTQAKITALSKWVEMLGGN